MQESPASEHAEFLRPRATAKFLNISHAHLRRLMLRGEAPPSTSLGKVRLFSVTTLKAWMRERETTLARREAA